MGSVQEALDNLEFPVERKRRQVTPFGKELKKLLLDCWIEQKALAQLVGVTPNYISEIIYGAKPATQVMVDRIYKALPEIGEHWYIKLSDSAAITRGFVNIRTDNMSVEKQKLVLLFMRRIETLDEAAVQEILNILEKR